MGQVFIWTSDSVLACHQLNQRVIECVLQETLAPRAARNKKSYVEDHQLDKNSSRKRRAVDAQEKPRRRSSRTVDTIVSLPFIDGAVAQVRNWSFGNMPKKDASRFVRAVICAHYQHI
jgi:chromodomain-helicase-DNA-binding protein 1